MIVQRLVGKNWKTGKKGVQVGRWEGTRTLTPQIKHTHTHISLSKTHGTFHRLEIISVYKTPAAQKVFFSETRPPVRRRAWGPFIVRLFSLFFSPSLLPTTPPSLSVQLQHKQTHHGPRLSSPIASIFTSNLISPKERKANEQKRAERRGEKRPAIMSICVGLGRRLCEPRADVFSSVFSFCCCPHSLGLFFSPHRKKAFKGAIVQSGWSGLSVSGQRSNTTNMAGTNQGPG